jgi:serine/threonine-protein kinase
MTSHDDRFARVTELFDRAQHCAPAERADLLETACAGDADLKAEVMALIDAGDQAGHFLTTRVASVGSLLLGDTPPALQPGSMLGVYRIERQLGAGGMGAVYLAQDTRLARPVTLKVLHPHDTADTKRRERLRFEARAAAGLAHPNVATVYALEELGGQLCIIGEYVPGRTARDLLDAGPLPLKRAIDVAKQVAHGLEAAHCRGILHRDLKPENILVGDNGVARILDFGIARAITPTDDAPRLTEMGIVVGTPGYVSPEQLEGHAGDARSDLFSFGTVLYEFVTGKNPFQGSTSASTAARVLTLELPALSQLNPLSPPGLDAIVARCLRKNPAERYARTTDLVSDLESLATSMAARVEPPAYPALAAAGTPAPAGAAARAWWRVHQRLVMVVLAVLAIGYWWVAAWNGGPFRYALFAGVLALAVAAGTMRVHLLFVERQAPGAIGRQLARTRRALLLIEVLMALVVAGASAMVLSTHQAVGITMLAVSAAMIVTAWIIEPVTTDAAFPAEPPRPPE